MDLQDALTTAEAARLLGISRARVHALIASRRLPARKIGRDWTIVRADLGLVSDRRPGRPRRAMGSAGPDEGEPRVAETSKDNPCAATCLGETLPAAPIAPPRHHMPPTARTHEADR